MNISFEIPEEILHHLLDPVVIPPLALVRYRQETPPALPDVARALLDEMQAGRMEDRIRPGERIAVAVGSRGINRLPEIVAALVEQLKRCGAEPFIVPAMGSHGGATADGQREVLAHLGITEDRVGAPIQSSMETVVLGQTTDGTPVRLDRLAMDADGIVLVARVKPHTAFHGTYESGMVKMLAIGLGKQAGAATTHARGFGEMAHMVPAMAEVILRRAPIRFALAVLENARDEVFNLRVVPAERIMADEPGLLEEACRAMPRLPYEELDVLVIDQIGKNISGDGADPNVTGRFPTPFADGPPEVNKQVVLDLSDASNRNANGIGTADFTTIRLARKLSLAATYPNALTSTVAGPVKLPMVLPSDRLALAAALLTCNAVSREPRLLRIRNTLQLGEFWISPALLEEARRDPSQEIVDAAAPIPFDTDGNLPDLGGRIPATIASAQRHDAW